MARSGKRQKAPKTAIVGRKEELEFLWSKVEDTAQGAGGCLLLIGEAGVGKTCLGQETSRRAGEEKGFLDLYGKCQDSATPFMPWAEALKKIKMESLVYAEPVVVEYASVMSNHGIMMANVKTKETDLDDDILNGMLAAVKNFVSASLNQMGVKTEGKELNMLQQGDYSILLESGENATVMAIVKGKVNSYIVSDLKDLAKRLHTDHGAFLSGWDGTTDQTWFLKSDLKELLENHRGAQDTLRIKDERLLIFDAVLDTLRQRAGGIPLMVVLDDMQWADSSTRELFYYIARNTRDLPVFLLGIYREEEVDGDSRDLIERMSREGLIEVMGLERLTRENVAEMISLRYGQASKAFCDAVFDKTEGNPFFVNEVLNTLEAREDVDPGDPSSFDRIGAEAIEAIPASVRDVVTRRLRGLHNRLYSVLEWMAVIGNTVEYELLMLVLQEKMRDRSHLENEIQELIARDPQRAPSLIARMMETGGGGGEFGPDQLREVVRELMDASLIKEEGIYKFHNVLIREVVYERIPPHARPGMHRFVGQKMEEAYGGDMETHLERLAHQFLLGRDEEKGYVYCLLAGDKAARLASPEEALGHYENALGFRTLARRVQALDKIMTLGESMTWAKVLDYGRELLTYYVEDDVILSRAHRVVGFLEAELNTDQEEGLRHLDIAVDKGRSDRVQYARSLRVKAEVLRRRGEYEQCRRIYEECMEKAQGDDVESARARIGLGTLLMYIGDFGESVKYLAPAVAELERTNQFDALPMGYNNTAVTYKDMGDFDSAVPYFEKSIAISEKTGHAVAALYAVSNLSDLYAKKFRREGVREDLERCLTYARETLERASRLAHRKMVAVAQGLFGLAYGLEGKLAESEEEFSKALGFLKGSKEWSLYADITYDRSVVYGVNGRDEERKRDLEEALRIFRQVGAVERAAAVEKELS